MKKILIITFLVSSIVCCAQVVERFDDGNFTTSPSWSGSTAHFIVNASGQLQLNNTTAGTSYLSTAFDAPSLDGFEWEMYVKQSFAGSASNYGRIYLTSNNSTLSGPLDGYYLQLGEAGSIDAVELFRQTGTTHVSVCRAANAIIAAAFSIRIRVTRSAEGLWTLYIDQTGGNAFVEAAQGTDATFNTSAYFGISCVYTATNATRFFYDDLIAGPPLGDVVAPELDLVSAVSANELLLDFSESLDAESISTDQFVLDDSVVPAIAELQADQRSVRLVFEDSFVNGKLCSLSVTGVHDVAQNEMLPAMHSFRFFVSEDASPQDIIFNEFFTDPSPVVGLPAFEFVELFNQSSKAFNLAGWILRDLTSTVTLPSFFILPGEYLIVTVTAALQDYQAHGMTSALSEMPSLNNSSDTFVLTDPTGTTIDSAGYALSWFQDEDKQQGGFTLERLRPDMESNYALNWMASVDSIGGTPGRPNSVLGRNPDSIAPRIDSLIVIDQHTLELFFSEALDTTSLHSTTSFKISTGLTPSHAQASNDSLVLLEFDVDFVNGETYQLIISGVQDLAGNLLALTTMPFMYFKAGDELPGLVHINEIMFDPSPVVQLPEAEYIEVVNISTHPYNVKGWSLSDATSKAILPDAIVLPQQHIVLTSTSNASKFTGEGKIIGVSAFPSLSNTGESLVLRSASGIVMDSVFFKLAWLGSGYKTDGGWSLERLDLQANSNEPTNWRASGDSLGGTPGRRNSVEGMNPDVIPPALDSINVRSDREVELTFSEVIDSVTAVSRANYVVDHQRKPEAVVFKSTKVVIRFEAPFPNAVNQLLSVSGVKDLAGNVMDEKTVSVMYFKSGAPTPGALLINEIMSDPAPVVGLPEAEFIEIVNTANMPFDLNGWTLSDATATSKLPSVKILPGEFLILTSTTNKDKFQTSGKAIGVAGFPSLSNTGEAIVLRDPVQAVIDSVNYSVKWIADANKLDGGWSLERLRFNYSSTSPLNWQASIDERGGTPGSINSQFGKNPDQNPPMVVSAIADTPSSIRVRFTEPVVETDSGVVVRIDSAFYTTPEWLSPVEIGLLVEEPFQNGMTYLVEISGVRDTANNAMDTTRLMVRYFTAAPVNWKDIVISEIMSDPSPNVGLPAIEFVELYNRSANPVQLRAWTFSDGNNSIVLPDHVIQPKKYVVLTSAIGDSLLPQAADWLVVSGFPSLSNEGEPLRIRSPDGYLIDSIKYSIAWFEKDERAEGGWSLELIDPLNVCGEEDNWTVCEDPLGGTPGKINSVNASKPDVVGPMLINVSMKDPRRLLLTFNEKLDRSISSYAFAMEPPTDYEAVRFVDASLRQVELETIDELLPRTLYRLQISQLYDCAGNVIQDDHSAAQFALPESPMAGDIVLNEILFNPRPGGVDFIELYNRGSGYVDVNGWKIIKRPTATSAEDAQTIKNVALLSPNAYMVFTTDRLGVLADYPGAVGENIFDVSLPSMPDDQATIIITDSTGQVLDSISYDERQHVALIRDREGVSLERISMDAPSYEPSNWRSAAESDGFATPGFRNSNSQEQDDEHEDVVFVYPEVISQFGDNTFALINYRFDEPGSFITCRIFDSQGRLVKEIANNQSVGGEGFIRWDGDHEDGARARAGYYIVALESFNVDSGMRSFRRRVAIAPR